MVAAAGGVTLLPALAVGVENRRRAVRIRPFKAPAPGRTVGLIWRRGAAVEPAAQKLAELLRAAFPRDKTTRPATKRKSP
jgi:LysR family hydrogen peroxide-inducible transcriptional activator